MYEISLLPPEFKARQLAQQRMKLGLWIGGGVLVVLLLIYGGLALFTYLGKAQADKLDRQLAAVEQQEAGFQRYVDMKDKIDRLHQLIKQAVGNRPDFAAVLSQTGLILPDGVWLTELTATTLNTENEAASGAAQGNQPGELTIRGKALGQLQVAQFLDNLQKVPGVTDIRCQSSKVEAGEGVTTVEFEIKASLTAEAANKVKGSGATL